MATRKTKTKQELVEELKKLDERRAKLEQQAYASDIEEMLTKLNVVSSINAVKTNVNKASDIAILKAIVKACGFKRITITQAPATPRKKK